VDAPEPVDDRATEDPSKSFAGSERGEEERGDGGGLTMVVVDSQGEPVVSGPLTELDTEHDNADQQ
jgi:hypothetical protein